MLLILLNDGDPRMELLPQLSARNTRVCNLATTVTPTQEPPPSLHLGSFKMGCALSGATTKAKQNYEYTPSRSFFRAIYDQCTCDEDYEYDQEYGPCGQYVVDHSHWTGRQM